MQAIDLQLIRLQILIAQMDHQYHQILAQSKILHTFTQFVLFEFVDRKKKKIAEGNCLILQSPLRFTSEQSTFLKMNNLEYLKKISGSLFVRVKYQNSTAYLFFHQTNANVVYAITIFNKSPYLPIFDQLLTQRAQLIQYQSSSLKYQDKLKIDFHCDKVLENQVVFNHDTVAKIGKAIGNFFGAISLKLSKPSENVENGFNNKIQTFSRESLSQQTRSKWSNFKQKASRFNDRLTELIKPVSQKGGEIVDKIGDSYNKSENTIIKSFRQLTKQTQDSLNQGFIAEIKGNTTNQNKGKTQDLLNQTAKPLNQERARPKEGSPEKRLYE